MVQILLVAMGAGAAAALLFASVASGSLIATLLFYLAPLPILIAAIGWSHLAGLVARAARGDRPRAGARLLFLPRVPVRRRTAGLVARLPRAARRAASRPTDPGGDRMVSGRPPGVLGRDHRRAGDRRRGAQLRHRQGDLPGRDRATRSSARCARQGQTPICRAARIQARDRHPGGRASAGRGGAADDPQHVQSLARRRGS